ncbi:MAG: shikimate dehydrogenase [Propionibacteriaceae bacterium]|jgi:shikimate dehydrogenase|nr:shikimate dehydrogenase [Propionibacteriaceae bacterium]
MKAAVLGSPIAHSLSPALHEAGFAALGLANWQYDSFEVTTAELEAFLAANAEEYEGFSLTMPLKRRAFELAKQHTKAAADSGVANTLVKITGGWEADNTDIGGIVDVLRPHWKDYHDAAVLGAGATATSALIALRDLGARRVFVYARDLEAAARLAELGEQVGVAVAPNRLVSWEQNEAPALVSTLPAGVIGPDDIERYAFSNVKVLLDVVYDGWPTPLAQAGAAAGATVVSGKELLVRQAARQFELFTGREAPIAAMAEAAK